VLLIVSCSSAPSESLAINYINTIGTSNKLFKVKSLKKTNGVSEGSKYVMEYDFELECLKTNTDNQFFQPQLMGQIACDSPGEIQNGKGWLSFEKTEKGWQVNNISGSSTWRTPRGTFGMNPY
jgi:hypothetical protein